MGCQMSLSDVDNISASAFDMTSEYKIGIKQDKSTVIYYVYRYVWRARESVISKKGSQADIKIDNSQLFPNLLSVFVNRQQGQI